jgi:predicted outer membrane repeat protein
VLGVSAQQVNWNLADAAFRHNSAGGPGGGLALAVPLHGPVCNDCTLEGNRAGSLGGALYSSAAKLCVLPQEMQVRLAWVTQVMVTCCGLKHMCTGVVQEVFRSKHPVVQSPLQRTSLPPMTGCHAAEGCQRS